MVIIKANIAVNKLQSASKIVKNLFITAHLHKNIVLNCKYQPFFTSKRLGFEYLIESRLSTRMSSIIKF
jgi:hypothetical protein